MDTYDVRFADLALPPRERDGRRARSLFTALEREALGARVDQLSYIVRESRGEPLDFTWDGLVGLEAWLRADAPIAIEVRGERMDHIRLTEISRALAIDLMIAVGELIRAEYPSAQWTLPRHTPSSDRRFLPELKAHTHGELIGYYPSLRILDSFNAIARIRAGDVLNWVPAPVERALSAFKDSAEKAQRRARESAAAPPFFAHPPIPAPPAATRERYRKAAAKGQLGEIDGIVVVAPMTPDAARALIENHDWLSDDDAPPNPAVMQFVTELYKLWPWVEADDTLPSPWTDELYGCIAGDFVSIGTAPDAASAEIFTDILDVAKRLGMVVYSTDEGDILTS